MKNTDDDIAMNLNMNVHIDININISDKFLQIEFFLAGRDAITRSVLRRLMTWRDQVINAEDGIASLRKLRKVVSHEP